ncbi:hypothetical protein GCM10009780_74690 [Actinomadura alba]
MTRIALLDLLPGEVEVDGFWRPRRPFSRLAVATYPDRFRYLGQVDRRDPKLSDVMRQMAEGPLRPRPEGVAARADRASGPAVGMRTGDRCGNWERTG